MCTMHFYFAPISVQSNLISISVCQLVCLKHVQISPNFLHMLFVAVVQSKILLGRQGDTLCTSVFVDDIMFSYDEGDRQNQR